MLDVLKKNPSWSLDGTFKITPLNKCFKQVFVVGAFIRGQIIVVAHALLPGKQTKFYEEVLDAIARAIEPAIPNQS
jgi:hypothetical protein